MTDAQPNMFPEAQLAPEVEPDERYTLPETLALCKRLAGVWDFDLDAAACEEAHCAKDYIRKEVDGLALPWWGRVWCNPPFSDIGAWVLKAWQETARQDGPTVVAMLLPANRTEQPWWQQMVEEKRDRRNGRLEAHFLPGRIKFGFPGNPKGVGVGSPPFGCVLLVWRRT